MDDRPSLFARIYLRMSAKGERRGQAQHRERTLREPRHLPHILGVARRP